MKSETYRAYFVEDDAALLHACSRSLGSRDIQVCGRATSVEIALREISSLEPDVVLLDVELAGSSCLDVARSLQRNSDIPIILLTAPAQEVTHEVAAVASFLEKPIQPEVLAANIELAATRRRRACERREAQERLEEARARLARSDEATRRLLADVSDVIVVEHLDGSIVYVGDRWRDLFGCPPSHALRGRLEQFAAPAFRERLCERRARLVERGGAIDHFEFEAIRADGAARWIQGNSVIIHDETGAPVAVQSGLRDGTSGVAVIGELRRSEDLSRLLQEVAHVGSCDWDVAAGTVEWTDELYRMHGRAPGTPVSTPPGLAELYPGEEGERMAADLARCVRDKCPVGGDYKTNVDGRWRTHHVWWRPEVTWRGELSRVIGVSVDITSEVERTAQLDLAHFALDQASDGFLLIRRDGRLVNANRAAGEMLGYTREQLLAMTVADFDPRFTGAAWASHLDDLRERGALRFEAELRRADGHLLPVEISVGYMEHEGLAYNSASVRDITERRRAEAALQEARRHYQSLFDDASEGIFRTDLQARLIDVNPAFACILEGERDTLRGRWLGDFYINPPGPPPADADESSHTFSGVDRTWRTLADRTITVELSAHRLRDAEGNPIGYQGFVRDVTQARAAAARERLLLGHKEQLELIVEGTRLGFWEWNPTTDAVLFSDRWVEMLGYARGELAPHVATVRELIHPDDLPSFHCLMADHLAGGSPRFETVHRMRHRDGRWIHVLDRGKVFVRDALGQALRYCGTLTDVTKEKEGEQAALEASRAKTYFIASMSHELRTPLNAILGLSESLLERAFGELAPAQAHSLRTIRDSGAHLRDMINDVLDLARVEAGAIMIEPARIALAPIIGECVALVLDAASRKSQRVQIAELGNVHVVADPRRLRQMLLNLLVNAVKFSPASAAIAVGGAQLDDRTEVWVSDTGPGVPECDRERIFEPFVRLDDARRKEAGGVGLGLAIVKRLAELHDGTVRVEGSLGGGARFVIALPVPVPQRRTRPSAVSRSPLVLIAGFDAAVAGHLTACGYTTTGPSGDLPGAAARDDVVLVVMDAELLGAEGPDTVRRIRSTSTKPILVVASQVNPTDEQRYLAAGATRYLSRPVPPATLATAIDAVLGNT